MPSHLVIPPLVCHARSKMKLCGGPALLLCAALLALAAAGAGASSNGCKKLPKAYSQCGERVRTGQRRAAEQTATVAPPAGPAPQAPVTTARAPGGRGAAPPTHAPRSPPAGGCSGGRLLSSRVSHALARAPTLAFPRQALENFITPPDFLMPDEGLRAQWADSLLER